MDSPNYEDNVPSMANQSWQSNSDFTYSLLSGVLKIAEKDLRNIFPTFSEIQSCKINPDDLLEFSYCDDASFGEVVDDFGGVFSYLVFWTVFALIFTIVGIIWCLCNKCCCCCGTGSKHKVQNLVNTDPDFDATAIKGYGKQPTKTNLYLRIFVGVLMALWIIGFSFSVFTAFASNESMRRSIFEFQEDVDVPLNDAELYLNVTIDQITAVFLTSFGNLSDKIRELSPRHGSHLLRLNSVDNLLKSSNQFISTFNSNKNGMEKTAFGEISNHLDNLKLSLVTEVTPLFHKFDEHQRQSIPSFEEAIAETTEQLKRNYQDLIDAINDIPVAETRQDIQNADDDVLGIVGSSIYGTFMAFNIVMLAILIGIIVGFVVSWIGRGAAKRSAFIFYRFTIATMFTVGWLVILAMVIGFIGAGFFSTIACENIRDLENSIDSGSEDITVPTSTPLTLLNAVPYQTSTGVFDIPSYGHIIRSCKAGASVYTAMKLEQVYDVSSIFDISDNFIMPRISSRDTGDEFFVKNIEKVYSALEKELIDIQSSIVSVSDFTRSVSTASKKAISELKTMYSTIEFQLIDVLNEIKALETPGTIRQNEISQISEVVRLVNEYENFVNSSVIDTIGQCEPLYAALNATVHLFCYKVVAPVATYWWSFQFLLIMFVAVIVTALVTERLIQ